MGLRSPNCVALLCVWYACFQSLHLPGIQILYWTSLALSSQTATRRPVIPTTKQQVLLISK